MPQNSQEQSEAQLLLGNVVKTPDDFLTSLLGILDFDDFYNTSFRLWEVFSNVIANPTNRIQGDEVDAKDYPDSSFTHFFQNSTVALSEYFTGCVLFSSLSLIRQLYRCYRQRQSNSYGYMQASLESTGVNETSKLPSSIDAIQASLGKLLLDINPYYEIDTSKRDYIKLRLKTAVLRAPPKPRILENFANKTNKIDRFFDWINKLRKTNFGAFCRGLWVNLRANTFMFWAIWMPFNIAVGTAALATTGIFAPVILSISLGTMAFYSIWKAYKLVQEAIKVRNKSRMDLQKEAKAAKEKNASKKEKLQVINNLRQRFFIEKYHQQQLQKIKITYAQIINQLDLNNESLCLNTTETSPNYDTSATASTSTKALVLDASQALNTVPHSTSEVVKNEQSLQPLFKVTPTNNHKSSVKNLLSQRLEDKTSERWGRLIIHTFLQEIAGFTGSAFILWFASYLLGTLASTSVFAFLGAAATFLGGPFALIGIGITLGIFLAIKGAAKIWQEQKDFQKVVAAKLAQEHVINNHDKKIYEFTGKSKLQVLKENEEKIINAENRIGRLREKIKFKIDNYNYLLKTKNGGLELQKLDKNNILINNQGLETISVIEEFNGEQSSRKFTWFKKFLNRCYELLAGQQTGIYLARIVFLSTGVAGCAIAGLLNPGLAFLIIAAVLSFVVGLPRLARYQLDRNQENRKKYINNLDTQIAYLENRINVLTELEKNLNNIDSKLSTPIQSKGSVTKNAQLKTTSSNNSYQMPTLIFIENNNVENEQINEVEQAQQKSKNTSFGDLIKQSLSTFFKKIGAKNVNKKQSCTQPPLVKNFTSLPSTP